jgi:hypothetical protein
VESSDGNGNAALHTMIFGSGNKSHQIVDGDIIYVGEAAPGTDESAPGWRVTKQEDLSAGAGTDVVVTHAYLPPSVYRGSFPDLAALQAAIPAGDPGNSAFVEDVGHTFYWDYIVTGDWADTGSAARIPTAPAKYSGFDHVFNNYADLLYA